LRLFVTEDCKAYRGRLAAVPRFRRAFAFFGPDLGCRVEFARVVASLASTSDKPYASSSQSVIGDSTSSRCLIWMMFATLDFDERSARRTCGAFTVRPRKTQTSRKLRFGRTKK
jgi:hypothetical protein